MPFAPLEASGGTRHDIQPISEPDEFGFVEPARSWLAAPLGGYMKSWGSASLAKNDPNWFGRNVLANMPEHIAHAAAFLPGAKVRIPNPIKAYHGSPHDFSEFSLSKIGTGEGAQAYGHGLYFAENENVARGYKKDVGAKFLQSLNPFKEAPGRTVGGQPFDAHNPVHLAADYIDAFGLDGGIKQLQRDISTRRDNTRGRYEQAMTLLQENPSGVPSIQGPGRMYEVNLHARPEQFLDWDKPLAGQSEAVRAGMGNVGDFANWRGSPSGSPADLIWDKLKSQHGPEAATQKLQEAGIPGIRYLDQGSRGDHAGLQQAQSRADALWKTQHPAAAEAQSLADAINNSMSRNYVVWTPEVIELLRKYGIAAPALMAPALASTLAGDAAADDAPSMGRFSFGQGMSRHERARWAEFAAMANGLRQVSYAGSAD